MGTLRLIVACPGCASQFDASGLPAGSQFHCTCGRPLEVPVARPQDAAVVRCSSCGAPRQGKSPHCTFCGADFTLHERDLDTLCPKCMSRISRRARFCHACATPLTVQSQAGEATHYPCPACGATKMLASRRLDGRAFAALECGGCGGLFVGNDAFRLLAEEARKEQVSHLEHGPGGEPRYLREIPPPQKGAFYRPCPQCQKMMIRQNYGRASGVIIDLCKAHGAWFDARELDRILAWIREGGQSAAEERRAEELALAERERRLESQKSNDVVFTPVPARRPVNLLEGLIDLAIEIFH